MNECKNYIHKYKCDTYNENHDACKSCEMQTDRPIVFTITQNDALHFRIYTKDSRADFQATAGYEGLFHMLVSISKTFNEQGYAVLFEVD